jgi:hypothetical protein
MESIYKEAIIRMQENEIGHHESDLYLKKNEVSKNLVGNYEYKKLVKEFQSQIDKSIWFDIPFAYEPFFEHKLLNNNRQ